MKHVLFALPALLLVSSISILSPLPHTDEPLNEKNKDASGDMSADSQTIVVTDIDLGSDSVVWKAGNTYILDGYVFLESGGVLVIEPGTRIEARIFPTKEEELTSALIITRGAKIFAEGTADNPIVFTAEGDDGTFNIIERRGSWGGLVILGNGYTGTEDAPNIAGFGEDERAIYGGTNSRENSGTLRYVSIRYGGAALSDGNELNGLTLGAVGDSTTIEFIEVFAQRAGGIEIDGGGVDIRHASVSFCGGDMYKIDEDWFGNGQYWFGIQREPISVNDRVYGGHHNGLVDQEPNEIQKIYNATFIGVGAEGTPERPNTALRIGNASYTSYNNSIFTGFANGGIEFDSISSLRYIFTGFELVNNIWFSFGDGPAFGDIISAANSGNLTAVIDTMQEQGNTIEDTGIRGISRSPDGGLDPRLKEGASALSGAATPNGDRFDATTYRGAFNDTDLWLWGWTALDELGYLPEQPEEAEPECIVITDADLTNGNYLWTADNCYLLDGVVFLEGGTLKIEAGTVVRAKAAPTSPADTTSMLVIASGATINAEGTAAAPIIFTAEQDSVGATPNVPADSGALWGGLAILGNAPLEEGVARSTLPGFTSVSKAEYGGSDTLGTSGVLKFVRVQHAGLNRSSLFLGGLGRGTTVDFVEVFASGSTTDAAFRLAGGTVNPRYLSVHRATNGDLVSLTNNWQGVGQFWFLLAADTEDTALARGIAIRGAQNNEAYYNSAAIRPQLYNLTIVGPENGGNFRAFDFGDRNATQGGIRLQNSVFYDFTTAINADLLPPVSYDLKLDGNFFWKSDAPPTLGEVIASADADTDETLRYRFASDENQLVDPGLVQPRRSAGPLDLRPTESGAASTITWNYPDDDLITKTNFSGAFCWVNMWADFWTSLAEHGLVDSEVAGGKLTPFACQLPTEDVVLVPGRDVVVDFTNLPREKADDLVQRLEDGGATLKDFCACVDNYPLLRYYGLPDADTIILDGPRGSSGSSGIDTVNVELVFESLLPTDGNFIQCDLPVVFQPGEKNTVYIALLDTGMDLPNTRGKGLIYNNDELPGNGIDENRDCVVDNNEGTNHIERDSLAQDDLDHGTPLASIMTRMLPDNVQPIIMNEKVYNVNRGNAFELTCGLHEAVAKGAQVVNMSLGFWDENVPIPLYNALKFAEEKGVLVVISAGNEGENLLAPRTEKWQGSYRWPGAFRIIDQIDKELKPFANLVVVGALGVEGDTLAYYSNYHPEIVNVVTQGAFRTIGLDNKVVDLAGTSMTAAFVSRIAALALAYNPQLTPEEIIDSLTAPGNLQRHASLDTVVSTGGRIKLENVHKSLGIEFYEPDLDVEPPQEVYVTPNPFFREVHFRLGDGFTAYSDLELRVYDACGELVYEEFCNGAGLMEWSGKTTEGLELPDGLYLYDLRVNDKPFRGKVLKFWRN
ncbi:MAG: S8 family serine peptidase [Bacteroidota bacterium]